MASLNQVNLIGNLTRDPELRVTPKGTSIVQFSIAINNYYLDQSGQRQNKVTYVDIEGWGKLAEICGKHLARGKPCLVVGRLDLDQWEDKQTHQKRSRLKVVAENVQFLGAPTSGDDNGSVGAMSRNAPNRSPSRSLAGAGTAAARGLRDSQIDEDVPF